MLFKFISDSEDIVLDINVNMKNERYLK